VYVVLVGGVEDYVLTDGEGASAYAEVFFAKTAKIGMGGEKKQAAGYGVD
jgi:hypothetical protein